MSSFKHLKDLAVKQRRVQLALLALFLTICYFLFYRRAGASSFTNEEINSLLSGQDKASDIVRDPIKSQSLHAPYLDHDFNLDNWEILGDTFIKNAEYIRLTTENMDQQGLIYNKNSFSSDGFEIEVTLKIHGPSGSKHLKGDGFAMFLTKNQQSSIGPVFGALDYFDGLGVFIDTYRNNARGPVFPYIMVMNGDGNTQYDKDHDGKSNELAGCAVRNIYNPKQGFSKIRLLHTVEDGYLSLDYNIDGNWKNCFSIKDVQIPKERYLSFSAATGQLFENSDLIDVDVYELKQFDQVIKSWRDFIEHIDEEDDDPDTFVDHTGRTIKRKSYRKKRTKKQLERLRAKQRVKELRKEAYNPKRVEAPNEGPSFLRTLWNLLKVLLLVLLSFIVLYIAFTMYRVKRRTWRSSRKTTGLLD